MASLNFPVLLGALHRSSRIGGVQLLDRTFCSASAEAAAAWPRPNPDFVDDAVAPASFRPESAVVYGNAVTPEEGESLVRDISSRMRRRRYEKGHWDAVITDYKEVELPLPSEIAGGGSASPLSHESAMALGRIRSQLAACHFGPDGASDDSGRAKSGPVSWIPCHGIDLKKDGKLTAHVDSVRYSGLIVAGLSLVSSSIMRLRPAAALLDDTGRQDGHPSLYEPKPSEGPDDGHVDLYLPPLSLYVLSGVSRYKYTHELLPCGAKFALAGGDLNVEREKRISVIFRDAK